MKQMSITYLLNTSKWNQFNELKVHVNDVMNIHPYGGATTSYTDIASLAVILKPKDYHVKNSKLYKFIDHFNEKDIMAWPERD